MGIMENVMQAGLIRGNMGVIVGNWGICYAGTLRGLYIYIYIIFFCQIWIQQVCPQDGLPGYRPFQQIETLGLGFRV